MNTRPLTLRLCLALFIALVGKEGALADDYAVVTSVSATNMRTQAILAGPGLVLIAGQSLVKDLVVSGLRLSGSQMASRVFTHLGGPVSITSLARVVSGNDADLIVTGSVNSARAFVTRLNVVTGAVAWTIIEPPRTVTTNAFQVKVASDRVFVSYALQDQVAVVAYRLADGVELWRSAATSTKKRECQIELVADRLLFGATEDSGTTTIALTREFDLDGVQKWQRRLTAKTVKQIRADEALGAAFFLTTDVTFAPKNMTLFRLDLSNGHIFGSRTRTGALQINDPLMELGVDRVIVRAHESTTVFGESPRFAWIVSENVDGDASVDRGLQGADLASCAAADRAPHFVSIVSLVGFVADLSRESAEISKVFNEQINDGFVATDDQLVMVVTVNTSSPPTTFIKFAVPRPATRDDLYEQLFTPSLNIPADQGVRKNDFGAAGATCVLLTQPQEGTVSLNTDGSFNYHTIKVGFGDQTFTYKLTANGLDSVPATVTLRMQPHANGMSLSKTRVKGGEQVTARVLFEGPRVTSFDIPVFAQAPASTSVQTAHVAAGANQSDPFTVFTTPVQTQKVVAVEGNDGDDSVTEVALLTIDPPTLSALTTLTRTVVGGGVQASFRLTIDSEAPTGGFQFVVSDDNTAIQVPPSVTVPAGATQKQFNAPTAPVTASRLATITATRDGVTLTTVVTIVGVSLTLQPTTTVGGTDATGTITLTSNAVGNSLVFTLSDNSVLTSFPTGTAVVPAGFSSGNFTIQSIPVATNQNATITISNGALVKTRTLTIKPPSAAGLVFSPDNLRGGDAFSGLAQLNGDAPAGGIIVTLTSLAPDIVHVPATVTVVAGSDFALFVGTTSPVTSSTMVVVRETAGGQTKTNTIVVTP